jgi:hypothetical protein
MKTRRLLLSGFLLGLVLTGAGTLPAAGPEDLYQATVPVAGRDEAQRRTALGQALERVLIKLSGSRDVVRREAARELSGTAAGLVQQYRYDTLPAAADGQPGGLVLLARFDPVALDQALRERGLPRWEGSRPGVLLWLGLEQDGQRRFLQPEADPALAAAVERVARERGLSFLYPLLDLEDLGQVQAGDLWGGFETRVREASARYQADLILVGRLTPEAAEWRLLQPGQGESWGSRGAPAEALTEGLQAAVDRIASRLALGPATGAARGVLVEVQGVRDLAGFLRADAYLRGLGGVDRVTLVATGPDRLLLRIGVRGGSETLLRGAGLGGVFLPGPAEPAPAPGAGGEVPEVSLRLRD